MCLVNEKWLSKVLEQKNTFLLAIDTFMNELLVKKKYFRLDLLSKSMLCFIILELAMNQHDTQRLQETLSVDQIIGKYFMY